MQQIDVQVGPATQVQDNNSESVKGKAIATTRRRRQAYRCIAQSPEGLVQQLAVSYLRHGYWFYVSGHIKNGKDPIAIDRKLIAKYEIDVSERTRADRKRRGMANMQYIRYQNWFLLIATEGNHHFKTQERKQIRDCRRHPIKFEGYSISYRRSSVTPKGGGAPTWHACVRIDKPTYKQLKSFMLERARHRNSKTLAADFARIPFARFAPVRRQLLLILGAVNKTRASRGFKPIPSSALRLRREILKPFGDH